MSSDWFGCVLVISLYIAEMVSESVLDGHSFSAYQLYFKMLLTGSYRYSWHCILLSIMKTKSADYRINFLFLKSSVCRIGERLSLSSIYEFQFWNVRSLGIIMYSQ